MPRLATPEEIFGSANGPLLKLELRCNACGHSETHEFEHAIVNPEPELSSNPAWDGVLLSRIVTCPSCVAIDDYMLASSSRLMLIAELRKMGRSGHAVQGAVPGGRVMGGVSKLWDGTIAQRPSQALAHLRELAERLLTVGEAWRRLGNTEERFSRMDQAERAWRKAVEVDPQELEATYSLAEYLLRSDRSREGFAFLSKGIALLPVTKALDVDTRLSIGLSLFRVLREVMRLTPGPFGLFAAWSGGEVDGGLVLNVSSVDLRKVRDWDRLAKFLVGSEVVSAALTPELPTDEPTRLQEKLAGEVPRSLSGEGALAPGMPQSREERRRAQSAPCSCGSGKKYKRCCGR